MTPVKSIKMFCLECMGMNRKTGKPTNYDDVIKCTDPDCYLFPFRKGKNPNRTGKGHFAKEKEKQVPSDISQLMRSEVKINDRVWGWSDPYPKIQGKQKAEYFQALLYTNSQQKFAVFYDR